MRRLSPEFIEQVRLSNDIVDIIGEDTFLKSTGHRYMGLCPFPSHKEKTPSFSVSADKQLYHCFGCGQSGNIFTYLQVRRGLSFVEAVNYLAERAGLPLPKSLQVEDKKFQERQQFLKINSLTCQFYEKNLKQLPASHPVKRYLEKRDLLPETIKKFHLGYALDDWSGLFTYLKTEGCNIDLALKLGLVRRKEESRFYDLFRNRLMFPVFAKNGKDVLGFGGRTLENNQAKYINSTDSPVFKKGQTFYGWQYATSSIRESGKSFVVEGYTDYLSLYQAGVTNTVATLGTALTEEHARWLSHYAEQVILSFDGDKAGERAAERSLNTLLSAGLVPKWLRLGEDMDPDSFVREKGVEALRKKAASAQDLFLSLLAEELKKYPVGVDRFSLIKKIVTILAQTKNEVLREYYTNRFLDSFGSDEKVAKQALKKALKEAWSKRSAGKDVSFRDKKEVETVSKEKNEKFSLQSAPKSQLYLLILAIEDPNCYKAIIKSGVLKKFSHRGILRLFEVMNEYEELEGVEGLAQILSTYLVDPRELQKERYPSLTYLSKEKMSVFIQDCINKVEEEKDHSNLKDITANMRLDKENTESYLLKIAEWTKKSKNTENKI